MSIVVEKVENLVTPIIENLGYEIVEIEYKKKFDGYNLTIYISKEDGITLDDCEKVSNAIDEPLDLLDPTNGQPYNLNVSSAGLDRPIKTDKDFKRNLGKEIDVNLYVNLDGKKIYTGFLKSFDPDTITINCNSKSITIKREQIAKAVCTIRF